MNAITRTARKVWLCPGCDGQFAPGTRRAYVQGVTEEGRPRTFSLCQICLELFLEPGAQLPLRDGEPDEDGRCSPWDMLGRGRRVMRTAFLRRMVGRCTTVPEAIAESAAAAARALAVRGHTGRVWQSHDQALARIPGPLAEC